jgi:hypothetical protein
MRPIALVGGGRRGVLVVYVVPRCKIAEARPRDIHMCSGFLCTYVTYTHSTARAQWSEIDARIPRRIWKQCRERWFNYLDPSIKKGGVDG